MVSFIKKRKVLVGILIFFVVGVIVAFGSGGGEELQYTTEPVKRKDLVQTVSATGKVTSASEIELKFEASGKVTKIYKNVGDQLEPGDLIAELDAQDLRNRVVEAQASLNQALASLERVRSGASAEELKVLDVQVTDAKNRLENTKQTAVHSVAAGEDSYATSQKNLEIVKSQRITAYENLVNKILLDSENKLFVAGGSLAVLDGVFADSDGQGNVGVLYSGSLEDAKQKNVNAKTSTDSVKIILASAKISRSQSGVDLLLEKTLASLQDSLKALDTALVALSYSTTDSSFTQGDLDAHKATVKAEQTYVNTAITAIQSDRSDYNNFDLDYDDLVRKAETTLAQAKIALDQAKTTVKANIDSAQGAYDLAQAQYNQKKAPARGFDIRLEEARVSSARAALGSAVAELDKARIKAPVKGILGKLNVKVGEAVSPQDIAAVMVGELNLEIDLDVPESDIVKVSPQDTAVITLDAFGDDTKFSGVVSFIDPAETLISDVVYYKVKVHFTPLHQDEWNRLMAGTTGGVTGLTDPEQARLVRSGMTANVDIRTNFVQGALVIPYRAVTNGKARVLVDEKPVEREVALGARGDDGLVEVMSGVLEGEAVIVFESKKK